MSEDKLVLHTFRCTDALYRKVRKASFKHDKSEAQIIRDLIAKHL